MALTQQEIDAIVGKCDTQAQELFKKQSEKFSEQITALKAETQSKVDAAVEAAKKGLITPEQSDAAIKKATEELSKQVTDQETILKAQGDKINGLVESIKKPFTGMEMIEDIFKSKSAELKAMHKAGTGFIEVNLKAAGVDSISNVIQPQTGVPTSPYAPGISNVPLTVYDVLRNQQFVSSYTDNGTTDVSRLAWINETGLIGAPALVLEGGVKPMTQRQFTVEMSTAKKVAGGLQITEEFDKDLPYLSSQVRSLLQLDLVRAFDDQIQADVIANASPFDFTTAGIGGYNLGALQKSIYDATLWDALISMGLYPRINNFIPNVSLLNPITWGKMQMGKDTVGRYNYPSDALIARINAQIGNKLFPDFSIVGDLKQFKVLVYQDFVLKMGWINDDFIRNQFTIVAEVRFHDYISTARKKAIVYGEAKWIAEQLNTNTQPIVGS
jgi:hypothetical protein